MRRVLIVDDDPHIRKLIRLYFEKDGFDVLSAADGEEALAIFRKEAADVMLLDLMMPGKDGFDVLREVRSQSSIPVLILTARGDTFDKVIGLELGADDYIEKPFEPKELIARVKAVLRRVDGGLVPTGGPADEGKVAHAPDLTVDLDRYEVRICGETLEMPPKELELLHFLASRPNRVFSREQLLEAIWNYDYIGESRTVDVHIKRIREKLDAFPHPEWEIRTVWRVGYKFELRKTAL